RHTSSKRDWSSDVCSSDLNRTHTLLVVGLNQPVAVVDHVAHHGVTYCQRVRYVTTHCRVGVLQRPTVTQHSTNALNLAVQDFHETGRAACRERAKGEVAQD